MAGRTLRFPVPFRPGLIQRGCHRGRLIFKRHNPTISLTLECVLLFLAIAVFSWGLQAKLSDYHTHPGDSTVTSSMAKLSIEEGSARSVASLEDGGQPCLALESLHLAAVAFSWQHNHVSLASLVQPEPGPRIPGRYNLHGPNPMRRPPPVLS